MNIIREIADSTDQLLKGFGSKQGKPADSWNTPPSEDLIKKTFTDNAVGKAPHHKNLLI